MDIQAVDLIQTMLAPGLMVSACGLLILGMNNKYSLIINRIRLLDEELRRLSYPEKELLPYQKERLINVNEQLGLFHRRVFFVRNAVVLYSVAVAFFILTSVFIGIEMGTGVHFQMAAIIVFLLGMISVLIGVIYAVNEVIRGYRIVTLELSGPLK